jgi:glycosyltransferase involved in cell wall biosynthesis
MPPHVRVVVLPYRGQLGYFRNGRALRRLLAEERPNLVNAHYASGYGTTARLARFYPTLLSVWGSDVYSFPLRSKLHRWLLRANLTTATKLASTSHAMARQTASLIPGDRLAEIAVTPFGVDMTRFTLAEARKTSDRIVVGTIKALQHVYGIDYLLRAFAAARATMAASDSGLAERTTLLIIGDGSERDKLVALAGKLGLSDVVTFRPHVAHDQVPAALHNLDVYVALSRMESFGVAVIEASACGLPVIVSDTGGLPEVVKDGETGFVVPVGDVAAAADRIVTLVRDEDLRRRMGLAGRERTADRYDWQANVGTMIEVYEGVVRAHRA